MIMSCPRMILFIPCLSSWMHLHLELGDSRHGWKLKLDASLVFHNAVKFGLEFSQTSILPCHQGGRHTSDSTCTYNLMCWELQCMVLHSWLTKTINLGTELRLSQCQTSPSLTYGIHCHHTSQHVNSWSYLYSSSAGQVEATTAKNLQKICI